MEVNEGTEKVIGGLFKVSNTTVRLFEEVYTAQCLNYLRTTGLPVCLLVNFYRPKLEIKRIIANSAWLSK
ncbi:MAG: GxxExxY protein [Chloroflexi bacterium]|nr:GxxExxY protein [Chloroflexota bacterium]MBI3338810.1 GxxExxY protein [Chloroflexota bacterium]